MPRYKQSSEWEVAGSAHLLGGETSTELVFLGTETVQTFQLYALAPGPVTIRLTVADPNVFTFNKLLAIAYGYVDFTATARDPDFTPTVSPRPSVSIFNWCTGRRRC